MDYTKYNNQGGKRKYKISSAQRIAKTRYDPIDSIPSFGTFSGSGELSKNFCNSTRFIADF